MNKNYKAKEEFRKIRRTLLVALCMLLVSSVMMATTSYAWFIMAVSPEVTGITTNVAANGSLEIALLTTVTRQNLSSIPTGVGVSLVNNKTVANNTWGNLVDLSDDSYGLSKITLMPARLDISGDAENGYTVGQYSLLAPTYGYDGRIVSVGPTSYGLYNSTEEAFMGTLGYGVRAFGTSNKVTAQASSLAMAQANVSTYTSDARRAAATALSDNGAALFSIIIAHSTNANGTYNDDDLKVIKNMVSGLQSSLDKIDDAMRQSLVAFYASREADEEKFGVGKTYILNKDNSLSEAITTAGVSSGNDGFSDFKTWVNDLEDAQADLNTATNACNALTSGTYTWNDLKNALNPIMNMDEVLIGEKKFPAASKDYLMSLMGKTVEMTLAPGSGVFADVADFTGDYSANVDAVVADVKISTLTMEDPARLNVLAVGIATLTAAGGSANTDAAMDTTYGYALDFAFRTNALGSNLLLQTEASQRVYEDSPSAATMGGGSYMEFSSDAADFSVDQMTNLMDAIRVAFVDENGKIVGIAKLNTSNRTTDNGIVKAPLYLYDFEISKDPLSYGALIMGERQKTDNVLASLSKGQPQALTAIVWLDGDIVDNTMVPAAAEGGVAMYGNLNLQFGSSADLIPANNDTLKNLATTKTGLKEQIGAGSIYKMAYDAGQGSWSTTSWNAFVAAFKAAEEVIQDASANENDVQNASKELVTAYEALAKLDTEELSKAIAKYREMMGTSTDPARYVLKENGQYITVNPYNMDQYNGRIVDATIYRVDASKNLNNEGNGILAPKYTTESWSNLASALYDAELLMVEGNKPTDKQIDNAIKALETAEKALERGILYEPYLYENNVYFKAIVDEKDTDKYGKWYEYKEIKEEGTDDLQPSFQRIVSDLMILKLDAKAKLLTLAEIDHPGYVASNSAGDISAEVKLLTDTYYEFKKDEILGINWQADKYLNQRASAMQVETIETLLQKAAELNADKYDKIDVAEDVITAANAITTGKTFQEAQDAIEKLAAAVHLAETRVQIEEDAEKYKEDNGDDKELTSDMRQLLTLAVNNAKTIPGYTDVTNTGLRGDVDTANRLLALEVGATNGAAREILAKLNGHLKEAGMNEVTENNSIYYYIPMGSQTYNATIYTKNNMAAFFKPEGAEKTGEATVSAVVITKNGVIFRVSKTISVFQKAEGIEITGAPEENTITINGEAQLAVKLVMPEGTEADAIGEKIQVTTWSSDNTNIVKVEDGKIIGVNAGTTTIRVSVETREGNTYSTTISITVE